MTNVENYLIKELIHFFENILLLLHVMDSRHWEVHLKRYALPMLRINILLIKNTGNVLIIWATFCDFQQ